MYFFSGLYGDVRDCNQYKSMVLSYTETFNTPEKASHDMLDTHVNSH